MIMSFIHAKLTMKKNENKSYVPSEDGINTDLVKKVRTGNHKECSAVSSFLLVFTTLHTMMQVWA